MKKVGGVLVSHGQLATELLAAAETVIGDLSHIVAVSIGWHDDVDAAKDEIARAIKNVSQGVGVLLMTDMFGGTPSNMSLSFLKDNQIEVLTGVNLPMLIRFASDRSQCGVSELASHIRDTGREGVTVAGDYLKK